jgi:hypothetical protein
VSEGTPRGDAFVRLLLEPGWTPGFGAGVAVGGSDTAFQASSYYTPERLRWVRGIVAYRRSWATGWRFEMEAGLGLAHDDLRGRRPTGHITSHAEQVWGDHLHTLLEARYSSSPGYRGWGFGGLVQLGF